MKKGLYLLLLPLLLFLFNRKEENSALTLTVKAPVQHFIKPNLSASHIPLEAAIKPIILQQPTFRHTPLQKFSADKSMVLSNLLAGFLSIKLITGHAICKATQHFLSHIYPTHNFW